MQFEWDDAKAADNVRKHGVSFLFAAKAFRDPSGIEWIDDSEEYGEERTVLLATADATILVVVFTERNERIRIISARKAKRHEQDHYYRENGA